MGLDKPLPTRYFLWLKGLLNGDMGKSVVTYHSITDDIKTFFPVTFKLVIMAMGWMIIIVFSIAILCARFHGKMFDHIVRVLTIGGICLPVFWLGFMLLLLFAVRLSIFSVVPKAGISGYITLFGQYLGYMLAGSAVAEKVFSLNGVGSYLVSCVVSGDSSAAAACIVIIATVFVIANLAADVINRLICPWMVREIND